MLELDECDQLLVANLFTDDSPTVSRRNNHGIFPTLILDSSEHHPLRSRSVSPARRCHTPGISSVTVPRIAGETLPGLTRQLSLDGSSAVTAEEDRITGGASEVPQGGSDAIIHQVRPFSHRTARFNVQSQVGPNDSFAGVALRYGVSIAALRRANQLWSSDPIHLRTELFVPRGDILRYGHKPMRRSNADANLRSIVEPPPDPSPDFVASFVAARNMILSVLPARISLDSLSSKASASEDHELDDLQTARIPKSSAVEAPFAEDGHELSILATPHARHKLPTSGVALSSQSSYSLTRKDHISPSHISSVGDMRSRSMTSSPTVSLNLPRTQPFAVLPVRTSQLEPEPAMELPVRRPRI